MVYEDLCKSSQCACVRFAAGHVGAGEIHWAVTVSTGELVDLTYERRRLDDPDTKALGGRGIASGQRGVRRDEPRGPEGDRLRDMHQVRLVLGRRVGMRCNDAVVIRLPHRAWGRR